MGYRDWLVGRLGDRYQVRTVDYSAAPNEKSTALAEAEAVVCVRYDRELPPAPNLRLVQVPGVGVDEIDVDALPNTAALCNVRGHGPGAAEFVILQMLEWRQRTREAEARFREGSWEDSSRFGAPPSGELFGSTVTLIGYGEIGRAVAQRLAPFGVKLRVANRSAIEEAERFDRTGSLDETADLVDGADFAVACVALTPETRGLVDAEVLGRLGPKGVLVNIARGPVVDEDALYEALRDGKIAGAVIDVWYRYPDPDDSNQAPANHAFSEFSNVVMTPHISGWTQGTVERRWADILDNLKRLKSEEPFINLVRSPRSP
jgi:phosphoglycerate dehydrogenase-like enzyme